MHIANTNLAVASSPMVPQYFVFAIKYVGSNATLRLVSNDAGVAGGMLGLSFTDAF